MYSELQHVHDLSSSSENSTSFALVSTLIMFINVLYWGDVFLSKKCDSEILRAIWGLIRSDCRKSLSKWNEIEGDCRKDDQRDECCLFWGFPWRSRPPDALQAVRMGHVGGMILQRRNDVIDSYRHIALSTERLVKDFYHLAHLIL